jgi:Leucine-rich repeat (LRR) protein
MFVLCRLESLFESRNSLSSPVGLELCTGLAQVALDNNNLTSLEEFSGMTGLRALAVRDNKVRVLVRCICGLTNRVFRFLQLTNVDGLTGLDELKYLYLDGNKLTSLDPLLDLEELKFVYLKNTGLPEIAGVDYSARTVRRTSKTSFAHSRVTPPPATPSSTTAKAVGMPSLPPRLSKRATATRV